MIIVAHVDDFLCAGEAGELQELYHNLSTQYELKQNTISLDDNDKRETTYLNRTLRVTDEGVVRAPAAGASDWR